MELDSRRTQRIQKCRVSPIKSENIMIKLLAKIFIKNSTDYKNPDVRKKYGILCGGFGVFLNILLFTAKFIAGTISSSIAMVADAFNNLSDAASSIISMLGFKLSAKKPTRSIPSATDAWNTSQVSSSPCSSS